MTGRTQAGTALTFAVLLAVTLGGCTMPDDRPDPQPGPVSVEAAKASMQAAFDDTIAFLRPANFVLDPTPNSEGPCDLPDGREGTSVLFRGWVADGPPGDVSTLADKVAGRWRAKGYRLTSSPP